MQILKEQFFSPPQKASPKDINTAHYPVFWQPSTKLTSEKVKTAIQRFKLDKTSRINGISSRFFKQVLEVFLFHFTCFFQTCIDLEYCSKDF